MASRSPCATPSLAKALQIGGNGIGMVTPKTSTILIRKTALRTANQTLITHRSETQKLITMHLGRILLEPHFSMWFFFCLLFLYSEACQPFASMCSPQTTNDPETETVTSRLMSIMHPNKQKMKVRVCWWRVCLNISPWMYNYDSPPVPNACKLLQLNHVKMPNV